MIPRKVARTLQKMSRRGRHSRQWRLNSLRKRVGIGHLKDYDPATAPNVKKLDHIEKAANDYNDT